MLKYVFHSTESGVTGNPQTSHILHSSLPHASNYHPLPSTTFTNIMLTHKHIFSQGGWWGHCIKLPTRPTLFVLRMSITQAFSLSTSSGSLHTKIFKETIPGDQNYGRNPSPIVTSWLWSWSHISVQMPQPRCGKASFKNRPFCWTQRLQLWAKLTLDDLVHAKKLCIYIFFQEKHFRTYISSPISLITYLSTKTVHSGLSELIVKFIGLQEITTFSAKRHC